MKKIILLGDTGFVGRNIAQIFRENNVNFVGVSRKTNVDLRDPIATRLFFKKEKPDIIVNCAAHVGSLNYVTEQAAAVIIDNSRMIISIYEAITEVCHEAIVINPIANCAYPANAELYSEDHWLDGPLHRSVLSFGSTRRFLWAVGESFYMQYGIRSIYLFVPNMYGQYESTDPNKAHALNAIIAKFVKAQEENKDVEIWGTGVAIREWLYALDFGRIVFQIIQNPTMLNLNEPINIAQNFGLSIKDLVEIMKTNFPDFKGNIKWNKAMPDGASKKVMDDHKFKKYFPDFKFTPFEEGIKNTISYYKSLYPY
ncbi:NAD-dependent epimerase/dehydratase family protein [Candidatus Peregrinibacteria bacterium]|nr:NAD-dependent epimerase/dehydratase family protein [Candidatus Peregrinibacteria bacterium]